LKTGLYLLGICVGCVGLVFLVGNQGLVQRMVVGIVLIAAGIAIIGLTRLKAPAPTVHITQDIDLPGESDLEQLKCRNCSAPLDQKSVELREGAIFVKCPYCGTSYQIEEAPKW
jgi:cytochrome c biogenesis protein CcdA